MAYINGIGVVSSQDLSNGFPETLKEYRADFLPCLPPDYKRFINPIAARRMSRLIRMGITSARLALADAGVEMPEAIITGTGLGSVEETEKLLLDMDSGNTLLNPTPFIQSTYNTISSQIAINLKCHHYNSTYVHRSFSFESAFMDALMQIGEGMADNALAGGIDEMTMMHLDIMRKVGHWKQAPASNITLLQDSTPGALAGEGAAFFVLGKEPSASTYCKVEGIDMFHRDSPEELGEQEIQSFLQTRGFRPDDIDLLVLGYNGDSCFDGIYDRFAGGLFPSASVTWFKHLSGEYYTASAMGLWLGAFMLKNGRIPPAVLIRGASSTPVHHVLVYNQYRGEYHSLFLLSAI